MRSALPFILVALAIFTAGCIAYIAWDLTSEDSDTNSDTPEKDAGDKT